MPNIRKCKKLSKNQTSGGTLRTDQSLFDVVNHDDDQFNRNREFWK